LIVILVIFCIGAIVAGHEFGHFIAAKLLGVKVKEFMLGLPSPKIFTFTAGGTDYGITILPIGGYVKFFSTMEKEDLTEEEMEEAFESQSIWKRIAIIIAGPLMNIILSILIIASIFLIGVQGPSTVIEKILPNSPAKESTLKADDKIVAIDDRTVTQWDEVTGIIQKSGNKEINITVLRDQKEIDIEITPAEKNSKGYLGIQTKLINQKFGLLSSLYQGAVITVMATVKICQTLYSLLTKGEILSSLGTPIRITQELTKQAYRGYIFFLQSLAFISIGLAIVNLIPLPPLDGGRILLLGVEAVMRKPIDQDKLIWIQAVGFLLLISLMIYLIVVDIQRLIPSVMRL